MKIWAVVMQLNNYPTTIIKAFRNKLKAEAYLDSLGCTGSGSSSNEYYIKSIDVEEG